jgi:hypothetical protein
MEERLTGRQERFLKAAKKVGESCFYVEAVGKDAGMNAVESSDIAYALRRLQMLDTFRGVAIDESGKLNRLRTALSAGEKPANDHLGAFLLPHRREYVHQLAEDKAAERKRLLIGSIKYVWLLLLTFAVVLLTHHFENKIDGMDKTISGSTSRP